jgi:hypothetical protein
MSRTCSIGLLLEVAYSSSVTPKQLWNSSQLNQIIYSRVHLVECLLVAVLELHHGSLCQVMCDCMASLPTDVTEMLLFEADPESQEKFSADSNYTPKPPQ